MDQAQTLGQRIKAARKAKRWTQAKLAYEAKSNSVNISTYENDLHRPRDGKLAMIATALEVDLNWLKNGEGSEAIEQEQSQTPAQKDLADFSAAERVGQLMRSRIAGSVAPAAAGGPHQSPGTSVDGTVPECCPDCGGDIVFSNRPSCHEHGSIECSVCGWLMPAPEQLAGDPEAGIISLAQHRKPHPCDPLLPILHIVFENEDSEIFRALELATKQERRASIEDQAIYILERYLEDYALDLSADADAVPAIY